ncbi:MAG: hypothetical protein IT357_18690 [Gemmatimonadaceae bacterium]|nr:hypothetical protein [Gemmatimonadaceae bacterium]
MRRRTPLLRLSAALSSAWLLLFGALAPAVVPCGMDHAADVAMTTAVHATPDEHHGAHADEHAPAAPFHPCDCASACCSLPNAVAPALPTATTATTVIAPNARLAEPVALGAEVGPRLLPFAHAPPV